MKVKTLLFTLFVSVLVALNLNVLGDDEHDGDHHDQSGDNGGDHHGGQDGDQENDQTDEPQGGQIDGSESLDAKVVLVATTNAPTGASGCAKLEVQDENGAVTATLEVKTKGLNAGDYTLSVVKKSDGSSVVLGTITITDNGNGSGILVSDSDLSLPSDLDPMDIGQIVLSDANGNSVLVGDLLNPTKASVIKFKAILRVKGTGSAAMGRAQAVSTIAKGKRTDRFTFIAAGVPAKTSFNVHVNGKQAGTVMSTSKGQVMVRKLPVNLLTVRSVRLIDGRGKVAATAKF